MFKAKIFRGSHVSTKIFYLEFFINEIFSVQKFPNYGNRIYTSVVVVGARIAMVTNDFNGVTVQYNCNNQIYLTHCQQQQVVYL